MTPTDLILVPGLNGFYSATADGKVYSHKSNKFVNPKSLTPKGYLRIRIDTDKGRFGLQVHRIIAATFLGLDLFDTSTVVHHKNHIKTDNNIDNLEIMMNESHNSLPKKVSLNTETHKVCKRCQNLLCRTEFGIQRARKDGLNNYCKKCNLDYNKARSK